MNKSAEEYYKYNVTSSFTFENQMTNYPKIHSPTFYLMALIWLTCGMAFGCASFEYGKALESGERPRGQCKIEMISENGERLKDKPMNLYLLNRESEKEVELKTPKIWLEGHIQTMDFDDDVWTIDFNGKKEKLTGTQERDGEKKKVTASLCTNQIEIFGRQYNLTPSAHFACNAKDPQVFPEFRVLLLNSKGRWFRLDLKCELNKTKFTPTGH